MVEPGEVVRAGQPVGWTWQGSWHVHLSEFVFTVDGRRLIVNPLRRGGKIHPYVDRVKPVVHDIRFYSPATPRWGRRPANVALLPQAGRRLNRARLSGRVDIRVQASDPQSFIGWFKQIPHLASPHHPFRMAVTIVQVATRKVVHRRDVFWAEQMLEMPAGQHFAPGTEQNLPANGCMLFHRTVACDGTYWFRLFPRPYWDTTRLANGRYFLRVRVWDTAGNMTKADRLLTIRN